MTPQMKHSEHVEEPISENCFDRISSLPDEVLGHVLSFLPTKLAVSTSILSTRWRNLFTLTTCLSFEDETFSDQKEESERIEAARKFKEFIDKVLELHQISPIKKFSLVCTGTYGNSDLNRWVSNALKKGVQELHYELANWIDVPDGFFLGETLVSETLVRLNFKTKGFGHNFLKIPLSVRMSKLKILHLGNIIFFDFNSMERLFSGCELLQKLTLEYCRCYTHGHATYRNGLLKVLTIRDCCFNGGTFEIDAPNLSYLKYSLNTGVKIVPSWKNSCSAYDDFDTNIDLPEYKYEHELLIAAASKATQFHVKSHSIELLLKLDEDECIPEFPTLSSVEVRIFTYYAQEYVIRLIDRSPELETFVFESGFLDCRNCSEYYTSEDCDCNSLFPSDVIQVPFSCPVQVIEVHNFCGHDSASMSLTHFLTNVSRLKRLIIHVAFDCDLERDLEIGKYLLMLPRASIDCHVEIKFGRGCTTLTSIPSQR